MAIYNLFRFSWCYGWQMMGEVPYAVFGIGLAKFF